MGNGIDASTAYDANGNIKKMLQWGALPTGGSAIIDDLDYTYFNNGNKLKAVTHNTVSGPDTDRKLGDFLDHHTGSEDYGYDLNGNMITDQNKIIGTNTGSDIINDESGISYTIFNQPYIIYLKNPGNNPKGNIAYFYKADGSKFSKIVSDFTSGTLVSTKTEYYSNVLYETKTNAYSNRLQLIGHEEGRIRPVYDNAGVLTNMAFDYFIKDHLGNVRMVLTEEEQRDVYPAATLESSGSPIASIVEKDYYSFADVNIVDRSLIPGLPNWHPWNNNGFVYDHPADPGGTNNFIQQLSDKMYRLNSASAKTGPSKLLKVMAGDKLDILCLSYHNVSGGNNTPLVPLDIITGIFNTPGGVLSDKFNASAVAASSGTVVPLLSFLNQSPSNSGNPKAYVNYVFLMNK